MDTFHWLFPESLYTGCYLDYSTSSFLPPLSISGFFNFLTYVYLRTQFDPLVFHGFDPGYSQTGCVAEDDLGVMIFLIPLSNYWDYSIRQEACFSLLFLFLRQDLTLEPGWS